MSRIPHASATSLRTHRFLVRLAGRHGSIHFAIDGQGFGTPSWYVVQTVPDKPCSLVAADPPTIPPEVLPNPVTPEPPAHPVTPPPAENPVPVREPPQVKPPVTAFLRAVLEARSRQL